MTFGPEDLGKFEFVRLSTLRAAQLIRGCTARVAVSSSKPTTTAQREVRQGKVRGLPREPPAPGSVPPFERHPLVYRLT